MKLRSVLKQVLAAVLCLCMCAGLVETALPAWAASGEVSYTEFYVKHVYLGEDVLLEEEGYINRDGTNKNHEYNYDPTTAVKTGLSRWHESTGDGDISGYDIYPKEQTYLNDAYGADVTELYTGYEIISGNDAVEFIPATGAGTGYDAAHFRIHYFATVPQVTLYIFYSYDGRTVLGANFGTELASLGFVSANEDVLVVEDHMIKDLETIFGEGNVNVGDIIYNTDEGLHTEKRATVDELSDGRTFDVTLESWYTANSNMADVGLILDSSGSMAFVPPTSLRPFHRGSDEKAYMEYTYSKGYGPYVSLGTDSWGNNTNWVVAANTDNSPLAYSGYSYYVYDNRSSVQELVPLAYWDGELYEEDNPLKDKLVGLYQFERTKDNSDPDFLKNGVSSDGKAELERSDHAKTGGDYKLDFNNYSDKEKDKVTPYAGSFRAYYGDNKVNSIINLDAVVEHPDNFTISFAVKTNSTGKINESRNGHGGPQAEDLVTIKDASDNVLYTILRGTAGSGNSQTRVRWWNKSENANYVDLNGAISEKDIWYVFTYVVEDGKVTVYKDGEEQRDAEKLTVELGSGPLHFTLGGEHELYDVSPTIQIDEVYIYDDRALKEDDVKDLVATMKEPAGSVLNPLSVEAANVGGTEIDLNKSDQYIGLSKEERAGWYYVNSTSEYDIIESTGSAKSLHGLTDGHDGDKYNVYPTTLYKKYDLSGVDGDRENYENLANDLTGHEIQYKEGQRITKASPCILYMGHIKPEEVTKFEIKDDEKECFYSMYLRCIFCPTNGSVQDSLVFVKPNDNETYTKAQNLQVALNRFFNRLQLDSPDSNISAVRFSTKNFYNEEEGINHLDQLLLQTWTNDPDDSTGLMTLSRGAETAGMAKATDRELAKDESDKYLYNYVITGGTFSYTGLKAFTEYLANDEKIQSDPNKYVILFTDGKDNELDDKEHFTGNIEDTKAFKLAKDLRDTYGYTIFVVRLVSGDAESMGEAKTSLDDFLQALAGVDDPDHPGKYFTAKTPEELEDAFTDIINEMPFKLTGYTVQDYIDPRFDLVADYKNPVTDVTSREIVHLHKGGTIHIGRSDGTGEHYELGPGGDKAETGVPFYFTVTDDGGTGHRTMAYLKYDDDEGLYYLEWTGQSIPLSRKGSHSLSVWSAVVTLRAKEDFIGGNTLLTNGPGSGENMVYHPSDPAPSSGTDRATASTPSKGFPRTQVNVKPYQIATDPTVDVRYKGETMTPMEALETLFDNASKEMRDLDHLNMSSDQWNSRDGSGYYYEYIERYINYNNIYPGFGSAYGGPGYTTTEEFLSAVLMSEVGVTLPYSFLPAVTDGTEHDHGTQTGGTGYENDMMGTITYKWAPVSDWDGPLDDTLVLGTAPVFIGENTQPKRYMLTVSFAPYAPDARSEDGLITESDYSNPRDPVGKVVTAEDVPAATATHTTYVVSGRLALKAGADKDTLQGIVDAGGTINVTLTGPNGPFTAPFKLDQTTLEGAEMIEGVTTVYLFLDQDVELPMGSYTMRRVDGVFTGLTTAAEPDYTWGRFERTEGSLPDVVYYISDSDTPLENTVTFQLGETDADARASQRAGLAGALEEWVNEKLKENPGVTPADLPVEALDPTWERTRLSAYLNDRLGMGEVFIVIDPPAQVTLQTKKTLVNSIMNNQMVGFEFTLTPEGGTKPVSTASVVFASAANRETEPVTFAPPLEFERPGTYTYTMAETQQDLDGFTRDTKEYTVHITVSETAATVTVDGTGYSEKQLDDEDNQYTFDLSGTAAFTNTYNYTKPPKETSVFFGAKKTVDGQVPFGAVFTFHLKGDGGVDQTVNNDADGTITFHEITYTKEGTYTYYLFEEPGTGNYIYDDTRHKVVVTVGKRDSLVSGYDEELYIASVMVDDVDKTGSMNELTTFNNTTPLPSQYYIGGTKIYGTSIKGEVPTFTFKLEAGSYTPLDGPIGDVPMDGPEIIDPVPQASPTPEAEATPVPEPEATPAPEPEATPVPEPEATSAPEPEATPAPEPEATPVPEPEATPAPEPEPDPEPDPEPETQPGEPGPSIDEPEPQPGISEGPGIASIDAPQTVSLEPESAPAVAAAAPEGEAQPAPDAGQTTPEEQTPPSGETVPEGGGTSDTPAEGQPPAMDPPGTGVPGDGGFGGPTWEGMPSGDSAAGSPEGDIMPVDVEVPMPDVIEVNTDGSGSFQFGPFTFEAPGTYTYYVYEVSGTAEDVSYDPTRYTVTFKVTGDAGTELTVDRSVTSDNPAAGGSILFLNTAIKKTGTGKHGEDKRVGDLLTYDVNWVNFSRMPSDVVVTELLDPGVTFVKAVYPDVQPDVSAMEGNKYTWTYENKQPGAAGTIELTTRIKDAAVQNWTYADPGVESGELKFEYSEEPETPFTVYNRASVTCMVNETATTMLTDIIRDEVTIPTGSLTISKAVVGGDEDTAETFTFTVTVDDAEGTYKTATGGSVVFTRGSTTVTLGDGESITIEGLPADARYTVTETDGADYETTVNGVKGRTARGTIHNGVEETAAFINTKAPPAEPGKGSLTIFKTVVGEYTDETFTFTVDVPEAGDETYSSDLMGPVTFSGGKADVYLKGGESITITGLPAGARYTVTETDAKGYTLTSSTDAAGNIPDGSGMTATFTNTKETPPAPKMGSLKISKTVTGAAGDTNKLFTFRIHVEGLPAGNYGSAYFDASGDATVTLKHGDSITITGLPADASYTVTEVEANADGYTTTATGASGTIPADGTAEAAFTNNKPGGSNPGGGGPSVPRRGDLSITKTVTGAAGETDREFHFTVTMPGAAGNTYGDVTFDANGRVTLTVKAGDTVTIYGLPENERYTVTEAEADTDGYTTSATGDTGTIPAGGIATAEFVNDRPAMPSPSPDPDATPGPSASPDPDATPGPSASPDPDATPGPSASPDPDATPSPAPTLGPGVTSEPFGTPDPSATPSPGPSTDPGTTPSPGPSTDPGVTPSPGPSAVPGTTPSPAPTLGPGVTSEPFGTPAPGGSSDGDTPAPRTGDETPVLPWLLMLIASGACLAAVLRKKKHF